MINTYQIYLISDSTGETLDRIFTAIKAQFKNINYKIHTYSFTRTENQILKILSEAEKDSNSIILYSIVDSNLAKYLANTSNEKKIPCFGVLGDLILSFSKTKLKRDKGRYIKCAIISETNILILLGELLIIFLKK